MKLLMHMCCSNCSLYPLKTLSSKGIDIKGFWLNPNIHPYIEYKMRIESLQTLEKAWGLDIEYVDDYGLKNFLRAVVNREDNRCIICYTLRLEETAKTAKKMGLDGFTTTLLVSPYQKFDMILEVGKEMSKRYAIPFLFEDFRPGWKETMRLSRELGLYRQKYCGCVYSEMERYTKKHLMKHDQTKSTVKT
jgi:predicted adenine nucleotide alpha hydrolase (AANH) superfamily ATPase